MSTLHIPLDALRAVKTSSVGLDFQNEHRLNLLQSWLKITKDNGYDLSSKVVGKQTLDIGCGQGDMIAIFAAVLQAQGNQQSKVTGVDPASPDYGEFGMQSNPIHVTDVFAKAHHSLLEMLNLVFPLVR